MLWGKEREPLLVRYVSTFVDFSQCLEFYPAPEGKRRTFSLQMRKTEVHRSEMACPSHTPLDRRDGASAPGKDRDPKDSDDHAP